VCSGLLQPGEALGCGTGNGILAIRCSPVPRDVASNTGCSRTRPTEERNSNAFSAPNRQSPSHGPALLRESQHGGGTLPYLAWRLHVASAISAKIPQWSYKQFRKSLRHFWYDTALSADPELMDCLISVAGPDRVAFGSDWPFGTASVVKESVKNLSSPGFLSATQRAAIARKNALALFPRFAG